jgi:hypothetical protein
MAESIRIRVGCSVDKNVGSAFRPIIEAAKDARRQIEAEMDRAWAAVNGRGAAKRASGGGPYRSVVREAERAADTVVAIETRKQRRIVAEQERAQRKQLAEVQRTQRELQNAEFKRGADKIREWKRSQKEERSANVGRARAIGSGSMETLGKIGRGALGVTGSIARGAGVQTDLGSYVGSAVELETRASDLSNSAYDEKRDKGKRIDPKSLVRLGRDVGQQAAFDPSKVLEGLQSFVGKTGDLATGQAALPGLAKLARATGTTLEDIVGAAGEASKALGDVGPGKAFETAAEKGKALVDVLRLQAGQGKIGAAELKDMAKYGGRLAAASQAFGGDSAKNLGDMGALAQLSIARGGAASAAEAATSVAGFANTLKTPARVKEFKAHGVDVYNKDGGFKSVRDILKDSSAAAVSRGGTEAPIEFKKMFANVKGAQAADPAFQAYSKAFRANIEVTKDKTKADMAGKKAIDELFDTFGKAISADEENDSFKASMKTSAAQVQLFNNKLGEIGGAMAEKVLPELIKAEPTIIKVVEAFAKMISWASQNPGTAITGAVVASIGKAAIGASVSSAVEGLIKGASSGAGLNVGNALSIVAASIAIASVGMLAIDNVMSQMDKGVNTSVSQDLKIGDALVGGSRALRATKTTGDAESDAALQGAKQIEQINALHEARAQQASIRERITNMNDAANPLNVAFGDKSIEDMGRAKADAGKTDQLVADYKSLAGVIEKLSAQLGKPLKVSGEVSLAGGAPGPTANTSNTTK